MKVKVKLDVQKLKRLALEHAEKVVFAVIAAVTLLMVFKSFGLPKFEKTPSDLQSATGRAQAALQTSETEATQLVRSELKPKDFLPIASKNTQRFSPQGFTWHIIKPPTYDKGGKRQEPAYFAVEDLSAHAARGVFVSPGAPVLAAAPAAETPAATGETQEAAPDEGGDTQRARADLGGRSGGGAKSMDRGAGKSMQRGGGGKPMQRDGGKPTQPAGKPMGGPGSGPTVASGSGEALSYVVLIGKVPFGKQLKAYIDALGSAEYRQDGDRQPTYLSPSVERAEAIPGVADANLKWVAVTGSRSPSNEIKSRLTPTGDPYLDPRHDLPPITGALYALAAGEWDPKSVVPEAFRAKSDVPQEVASAPAPAAEEATDTPDVQDAPPDLEAPPGAGAAPPAGGTPGGQPMTGRPMAGGPAARRPMGSGRPMGGRPMGGRPMGGKPMGGGGSGGAAQNPQSAEPTTAEYALFRFFDFSAEPGKRYRYRVKLWLENPNYEVKPEYLEEAKLAEKNFRGTELSQPTEPVTVPNEGTVIAGEYNPPMGPLESSANVVITQILKQGGQTAVKRFDKLLRGQVANIETADAMILEEETGELIPWDEKVRFRNNAMLLDVAQTDSKKPADVLILDAEGKLVVLAADEQRFKEVTTKLGEAEKSRRREAAQEREKDKDKKSGKGSMGRPRRDDGGKLLGDKTGGN